MNTFLTQTFVSQVSQVTIMRTVAFVENSSFPKEDKESDVSMSQPWEDLLFSNLSNLWCCNASSLWKF